MKRYIAALLLTTVFAAPAHAARGAGIAGTSEKLVFVATTKLPGSAGARSLCLLVEDWHVFFVPLRRSLQGYAIAENNCDADQYSDITAAEIQLLKMGELIATDVSDEPTLGLGWTIWNYGVIAIGGILALAALKRKLTHSKPAKGNVSRHRIPLMDDAIASIMCHVAIIDGHVDQREMATIAGVFKAITGRSMSQTTLADKFANPQDTMNLLALAQTFKGTERDLILQASMAVAAADGQIDTAEYEFLCQLAHALELSGDQFRATLSQMIEKTQPQQDVQGQLQPA